MSALFDPEPHLKEPLLRLLLLLVVVVVSLIALNDFGKADWELWWAYSTIIAISVAGMVFGKWWGYRRTSVLVIHALSLVVILALVALGYNGEHNVFLIALYLIALILVGTLFLDRLLALVGQMTLVWTFFLWHIGHLLTEHLITERAVTANQQLVIPALMLLFVTIVALVIREVFGRIKAQYVHLAEARLRGQEAMGQLVRGIAHHLNTPLGNAKMVLSMTTGSGKTGLDPAAAALLSSSVEVSIGLVSRLSGFIRLCEHPPLSTLTIPDLEPLFLGSAALGRVARWEASAEFVQYFATPRTFFWESVAFVVAELSDNAWRFHDNAEEPPVVSADFRGPGTLVLRVTNEGRGIDPALLPSLRNPFFSSVVSADHPGLGLFFADYLTEVTLGGHMDIASRSGEGTVVTLQIPLDTP